MSRTIRTFAVAALAAVGAGAAWADPEYVAIRMEIDVAKPAAVVWEKVGGFCDISVWIAAGREVPCAITSGDGGIGTVRSIANGAVIEVLTAQTELAYGYAMPPKDGAFNDLYHGFVEVRPVSATASRIIYTLMYDVSNLADQAAKDENVARRRTQFEAALVNMKALAEKD